jgi:hypothetical protein
MRRVGRDLEPLSPDDVLRLERAQLAEQLAWEKVKGSLPGSPGHSPELWAKWRERVQELRRLSRVSRRATNPEESSHVAGAPSRIISPQQ